MFFNIKLQISNFLHFVLDLFIGTYFVAVFNGAFFLTYIFYVFVVGTQSTIIFLYIDHVSSNLIEPFHQFYSLVECS